MHYHWEKELQKKNVVIFNSAHQAKKQCNFDSVWLEQQQVAYEHICKKVYAIQEQQLNQLQCYNQSMGFVARIDHNVTKYRTDIRIKKYWWSMFVCLVDVVLQGVWVLYHINKDEDDESLPLLAF